MLDSRLLISYLLFANILCRAAETKPQTDNPEYEWVRVTAKAPFAARDGAGALVFDNKMWLLGGWNPQDKEHFPRICSNDIWTSADGQAWSLLKPNSFLDGSFNPEKDWEGRHTAGYVVFQDKLWIIGGDPIQRHYQGDVWNSANGKTWHHVNAGHPVPWGPRILHYTVVFKNRLWVMGGQTTPQFAPGKEVFYRDIWNSADGVHWQQVIPKEPFWPQRGLIGGSAVFQDRVWVLGGGTYDTPNVPQRKYYNDVWSSADGTNWTCHLQAAPWAPREYHDVAVFDHRLWVCEGFHEKGGNRNDVWHSADGVHWREVPNTPWKPRHAASLFVHDNALWMVAGNNMEPDVWKLLRKAKPGSAAGLKFSPPLTLVGQSNVVLSALLITNLQGPGITLRQCLNIRIENCSIGPCAGEAVSIEECENIAISSNRFEKISTGVYALSSRRISVTHNLCRNVQGPMPRGQLAQFNKVSGPGNSISYNACQNLPGESHPEDAINLYQSSGTPGEPIQVVGNRIRGGGPSGSGGGIMLGDNGGSYILAKDNLLVDPGQYGIAVAGGDHIQVINNKVFGKAQPFTNVGLYIWNQYSPPCHDHLIKANQVRWSNRNGANAPFWSADNCSSVEVCADNDWHAALDDSLLPERLF